MVNEIFKPRMLESSRMGFRGPGRQLIYYRDPLLDTICDRIADLDRPAYIKNSELVYVAVNDAYARLFNLGPSDLVGTGRGD